MAWRMNTMIKRCFCLRPEVEEVRVLDFRHSSLSDVPNEVFNFERTLEELHLNSNQIHDLPRPLFHCHGLRFLSLSDNEIHSLPHAIASLINLEQLDISKNGILDIPDNIKGCKCLRVLDASVNPLGKLSEGFTQLINLEELYLNDTFIDFLPANFGRLVRLRILELRENHLKSLSKSMARLTELSRLDIGQNDFKELECSIQVIGEFGKLSELWCDCNRISSLPAFFGKLKNLAYLDASQNRISSIPMEIESCINLTDLTLSQNDLPVLPDSLGKLVNLSILRLDGNQLRRLPDTFGKLCNLEELILSQNDLRTLPTSLGVLRKMHTLIVDDNLLEELPSELGSCSGLTILSFRGNRLEVVPDELGHLVSLSILNLSDNRLRYLPFSITKLRNLQALWLSENQNKPIIPLQSDIDIDTGQRVLTCYIFPQVRREDCDVPPSDSDSFQYSVWEEQRPQRLHIKFAVDEKFDRPGKSSRSPAAYPKELKAHAKHARNQALKIKAANYVNVDDVIALKDANDDVIKSEPMNDREVVVIDSEEVRVWPTSPSVVVKEARVTKSQSHSPKPHDRRPALYKFDKSELAKEKARILHRTLQSSDSNTSFSSEKAESEKSLSVNSRMSCSASGISRTDTAYDVSTSSTRLVADSPCSQAIDSRTAKTPTAKILKFSCLKSTGTDYVPGDVEVARANFTKSLPSKTGSVRATRSDGYVSDIDISHSRHADDNGRDESAALLQTTSLVKKKVVSKSATISAAVARKLGCSHDSASSQGSNGHRGFPADSFNDVVPPSGYLRMLPPRPSIIGGGWPSMQPSFNSQFALEPDSQKPHAFISSLQPLPNLPARSHANRSIPQSPCHTNHNSSCGPPVLPPKQRNPNVFVAQPRFSANATYSNEQARVACRFPPSQHPRKPPPPYHVAASYSRQAVPGANLLASHEAHAPNSGATGGSPGGCVQYHGGAGLCSTELPSRSNGPRQSPLNVRRPSPRGVIAHPVLPTPMRISRHGSDSSDGATPPSPLAGTFGCDRCNSDAQGHHRRSASTSCHSKNPGRSPQMSSLGSLRRPDTLSLRTDYGVINHRSLSAPSTPPSQVAENSAKMSFCLPPYRTPPLYQSVSTGSLPAAHKDGGLLKMCLHSPATLRRLGSQMRGNASSASLHSRDSSPTGSASGVFKKRLDECRPLAAATGYERSLLNIVANDNDDKNDGNVNSLMSRCRKSPAANNGIFTARPVVVENVNRRQPSESGESSTESDRGQRRTGSARSTPPAVNYSSHPVVQLQIKPQSNPWLFGQHRNPKVIPVVIQKNPNLGFTISWNLDETFSGKGVSVATVTPDGSASSVLQPGDKLLQIDGVDITSLDESRVKKLLEDTGSTVFLMILRDNAC